MRPLEKYQGTAQFGAAYQYMLEHDAHAAGSVDRQLLGKMVRLCRATKDVLYADYSPTRSTYIKGLRPELEEVVKCAVGGTAQKDEQVLQLLEFTKSLKENSVETVDRLVLGGTEERIIARGSDWCVDVARTLCALCQVGGIAARLVMLFNTAAAYSGHVVVEAYRGGAWGVLDAVTGVPYGKDGRPATTWELMSDAGLVQKHRTEFADGFYSEPEQFRAAALVNYFVADYEQDDYQESTPNDYYREILAMSAKGWPGGLRWLRGEDRQG